MKRPLLVMLLALFGLLVGLAAYGAGGRAEAIEDSRPLARKANWLIARGRSGDDLGAGRAAMLLAVEDPRFLWHEGADFATAGGGKTTITQSLAKRLAFERFEPGVTKIRQTGYARGLEERLTKSQILALWLETVEMGPSRDGWLRGFFTASHVVFGRPPAELTDREFLRLVAVAIAPARFRLEGPDSALDARVTRIERMLAGQCRAMSNADVWLQGCAAR